MNDVLTRLATAITSEHIGPDFARDNTQMVELQMETPTVDKMLDRFNKQWEATAMDCVRRAEELEAAAVDLRTRANNLLGCLELTKDVKDAVLYEINARNRALSLTLVNPDGHG